MHQGKRIALVLAAGVILLSCAVTAFAAGEESTAPDVTEFATWGALTEAHPNFEVHDVELPAGTGGRVTWSAFRNLASAQYRAEVVAYTADGTRIPAAQYEDTYMEKDQTFALVSEEGRLLELCIITAADPPASTPTPEPAVPRTWTEVCEAHPQLNIQASTLPGYLDSVPWTAFLMGARYLAQFEGILKDGNTVLPFDEEGEPLLTNAEREKTVIRTGQHFLVMSPEPERKVLALYDVTAFAPDDGQPEPVCPDWEEYCAQNLRYKPRDTGVPQDLLGKPWIILSVVFRMSGHYIVIPFDAQGRQITRSAQKTVPVEDGQHFALLQEETGRLTALMNIRADQPAESTPTGPSSSEPAGPPSAEPTLPPVIITPAPTPDTPSSSPTQAPPTDGPQDILPVPKPPLAAEESEWGWLLTGLTAGTAPTEAGSVTAGFDLPEGMRCEVYSADGEQLKPEDPIATGSVLIFTAGEAAAQNYMVVMRGDVTGTGILSISQVVRMARALTGADPLTGPWLLAADLNGNGAVDISDLTQEAGLLTGK